MLAELLNGRCSFIFTNLFTHTTTLTSILIIPLFQSIFTSPFHPCLFRKSTLQFPLTLPYSIAQQFFAVVFLCTTIPTIFTKNIFPTCIRLHQGTRELESLVKTYTALIPPFFLKVWAAITVLTIIDSLLLRLGKSVYCRYLYL